MRLPVAVAWFVAALSVAAANPLGFLGAAKGALALGSAVAKLVTSVVPTGLLMPLALVAPLKLSLPLLFGLKGMGLFKLKLFMLKAPLLGPIGLGIGKIGLASAKMSLAKTALSTAGKATMALLTLPPKIAAMKVGAIAGAKAGAKAGLASSTSMPKSNFFHPMIIPASALLAENRLVAHETPVVYGSAKARPAVGSYAVPEPEPEEPVYARKPTTTTTTTTTTSRPAPAYTPASEPAYTPASEPAYTPAPEPAYTPAPEPAYTPAPEPAYGRRRRRRAAPVETASTASLYDIFTYIRELDNDRCVLRTICEIAADPTLAGDEGRDVTSFMLSLDDIDDDAPWIPFRNAAVSGKLVGSRRACHKKYRQCPKNTESIISVALRRLDGDEK